MPKHEPTGLYAIAADAKRDHERALARERKRRQRSRASHESRSRVTEPVTRELRPREVRVIQGIMDGKTQSQALADAGFNRTSHTVLNTIREPLRAALHAHGLTIDKVSESVKVSLDATSPMLTAEGCIDRPDWPARAAGRRDAIALLDRAGELPAASQAAGGGGGIHYHVHLDGLAARNLRQVGADNDAQDDVIDVSP